MRSFITADIDAHYIEALRRYYQASDNRHGKIVGFSSNQPSPFLRGSIEVAHENHKIVIIDSFNGTRPFVFNHRFLVEDDGRQQFQCGFIFDSQVVVDSLHRFVTDTDGRFRATAVGLATANLIRTIAEYSLRGWDINPFFYIMEALSKAAFDVALPWAQSYGASIMKLQSMDDRAFIKFGEIIPDPNKLEEHAARHGRASFELAAASVARDFYHFEMDSISHVLQVIYACLLKIGILQHRKADEHQKLAELFEFFGNDIGAFMLREAVAACLHFRGQSRRLIPIQFGAKDVKKKLMASAWDLFLLRLPEALIENEGNEYTSIYYVCTADKALHALGRIFVVRRVSSISEGVGSLPSCVGILADALDAQVGSDLAEAFHAAYIRNMSNYAHRKPGTPGAVATLIQELEEQASKIVNRF
jgi:hypothetical protein